MDAPVKKMSLISLAIPILIEQVLRNLMGTVNVFMLSNYSDGAVAAVGVANQIINVVVIAFTLISSGGAIVINHALGAKEYREGAQIGASAVAAALMLGLLASGLLSVFAPQFIRLVNLDASLAADAAHYLRIMGGASAVLALSSMICAVFRCYGNTRIPMAIVILNNILNVIGSAIVIFRPFETPLAGVEGVAVVRAASETAGLIVLAALLARSRLGIKIGDVLRPKITHIKRITSLGLMTGMEGISYTLGQVVTTSFLAGFATASLSAKVYVQNVDYYAYLIGLSVGQATQIMAGHLMGAGKLDDAYRIVNRNWRLVILSNVFFGTLMFLLSPQIMRLFTEDPAIIAIARQLFLIDIFIHAGRSMNHSMNYGLRAAGYVFWPMIIASSSIWLVNVGLGRIFSGVLGLGVVGLWLSQMLDEWVRGLAATILWRRRSWQKKLADAQAVSPPPPSRA